MLVCGICDLTLSLISIGRLSYIVFKNNQTCKCTLFVKILYYINLRTRVKAEIHTKFTV